MEAPDVALSAEYLEKHHILELFKVLLEQPADPVKFLVSEIEKIQSGKAAPQFTSDDLDGVFTTFDVIGRGSITAEQYQEAMKSLGVEKYADQSPSGTLDLNLFKQLRKVRTMSRRVIVDSDIDSDEDFQESPPERDSPVVIDEDEEMARAIQASYDAHQALNRSVKPQDPIVVGDDYDLEAAIQQSLVESGGYRAPSPPVRVTRVVPPAPRFVPAPTYNHSPSFGAPTYHQPRPLVRDHPIHDSPMRDADFDVDHSNEDDELQEAIRRSMMTGDEDFYPTLTPAKKPQDSATRLQRVQDSEYEESLRRDRQKQLAREEEEQLAAALAENERLEAERSYRAEQRAHELKRQKLQSIPEEPPMSTATTNIAFRFPDGQRFSRRFMLNNTVTDLRNFIETRENVEIPASYSLVCPFPRISLTAADEYRTLSECNLHNCALNVVSD